MKGILNFFATGLIILLIITVLPIGGKLGREVGETISDKYTISKKRNLTNEDLEAVLNLTD